jgi:lipopolysaccharide/colanic/teichoic acid biosynthesis glycosyltransferase
MGVIVPVIKSETAPAEADGQRSYDRKPGFYACYGKRCLDVAVSAAGLLLLSPLFLAIALLSKCLSPGPVFYLQRRVGKDNRDFLIVKFRTMIVDADQRGAGITVKGDARITKLGRYLRLIKLDELPQLWNVLKGEMSLVGPRPELPRYVADYSSRQREVLSIRPGITDAASLHYRHEESVLANSSDSEALYRKVILPHKLQLNVAYLNHMSFGHDIALIFKTLHSIFAEHRADRRN